MSFAERFDFTSLRRSDADEIIRNFANKAITKNLRRLPSPYTYSDAMARIDFLEAEARQFPGRARLRLDIRQKTTEKPVGDINIWRDEDLGVWILGYWLTEELWGQGIMTWACSEVLKRAREEGVTQVLVDRFKEVNFRSRRVLEKNGFRHLGDAGILLNGEVRKEWEYEIQL
jgi:RimJ/RimL family protein N-acetyltransferase